MKLTHIISLKMLKLKTHRWDLPFLVLQRWFENLEAVLGRAALTRPSSGAGGGAGQSLGFGSPAHFLLNDKRARVSSCDCSRGPGFAAGASGGGHGGEQDMRTLSPRRRGVTTWGWSLHTRPQRGRRRRMRATRGWGRRAHVTQEEGAPVRRGRGTHARDAGVGGDARAMQGRDACAQRGRETSFC